MATVVDAIADADGLLRALAGGPALVPVADVPRLFGLDRVGAADALAGLQDLGLVEVYGDGRRADVILSPLGASRLGVELETDDAETGEWSGRWVPAGESRPPARPKFPRQPGVLECDYFAGAKPGTAAERGLDSMPDPTQRDPAELVNALLINETPKGRESAAVLHHRFGLPLAWRILGAGPRWDGPDSLKPGGVCPGCGGRPLKVSEACVFPGCDRSGTDALLPPQPKPKPARQPADDLAGGVGGKGAKEPRTLGPVPLTDPVPARPKRGRGTGGHSFDLAALRRRLGA